MIKYLPLLLLIGCTEKQLDKTEFYYGQKVIVTKGFYKGQIGRVTNEGKSYTDCFRTYEVFSPEMGAALICNDKLEVIK